MIRTVTSTVFRITVAAFLIGGAVVVGLQAVGIVMGNGAFIDAVSDHVAPWVYGAAGVAGLLAFALSYFPHGDGDDAMDQNSSPAVPEHA